VIDFVVLNVLLHCCITVVVGVCPRPAIYRLSTRSWISTKTRNGYT